MSTVSTVAAVIGAAESRSVPSASLTSAAALGLAADFRFAAGAAAGVAAPSLCRGVFLGARAVVDDDARCRAPERDERIGRVGRTRVPPSRPTSGRLRWTGSTR